MNCLEFSIKDGTFIYNLLSEQMCVSINIYDPGFCSILDFENVSTGDGKLAFTLTNGAVLIIASKGRVSFEISKFGNGGDGAILISMLFELCRDALVQGFEARKLMS